MTRPEMRQALPSQVPTFRVIAVVVLYVSGMSVTAYAPS
jgi:hypothetical protein